MKRTIIGEIIERPDPGELTKIYNKFAKIGLEKDYYKKRWNIFIYCLKGVLLLAVLVAIFLYLYIYFVPIW